MSKLQPLCFTFIMPISVLLLGVIGCGNINTEAENSKLSISQRTEALCSAGIEEQGRENAIENCQKWGYSAKGTDIQLTCERLMRADYLDDDKEYTFPGTVIGFLDKDDLISRGLSTAIAPAAYPGYPDLTLKSIWGPKRAFCTKKPRWKSIAPFNMWSSVIGSFGDCDEIVTYHPDSPWSGDPFKGDAKMLSYSDANDMPLLNMRRRTSPYPLSLQHQGWEIGRGGWETISIVGALFRQPPYTCTTYSYVPDPTCSGRVKRRCDKLGRTASSEFISLYQWMRTIRLPDGTEDYDTILTTKNALSSSDSSAWREYKLQAEWAESTDGKPLGLAYNGPPESSKYKWASSTSELFLLKNTRTGRHAVSTAKPSCSEVVIVQSLGYIMKYPYDRTGYGLTQIERVFCGTELGVLP